MSTGKLYSSSDEKFISNVSYQFHHEDPHQWWGELTLTDALRIKDGGGYLLELEDCRKGRCILKKRVNRAVTGVPPRYVFHFAGNGPFK